MDFATLPFVERGDATVQDESETLVGHLVDPRPGERVRFVFANRPGRWTLGFLSLIGVAPLFLTVERAS